MKLSDAIRLGALLHPQCFGTLSKLSGGIVSTCALGAAEQAGYPLLSTAVGGGLQWLTRDLVMCPCSGCRAGAGLIAMIPHLNDVHRWTREKIADFVATIEPADGGPTPAADAVDPHAGSTGPTTTRAEAPSSSSFVRV